MSTGQSHFSADATWILSFVICLQFGFIAFLLCGASFNPDRAQWQDADKTMDLKTWRHDLIMSDIDGKGSFSFS